MLNFDLNDEQKLIQQTARDFAEKEIAPVAHQIDQKKCFPADLLKKMAPLGFLGALVPEAYGGSNLGNLGLVLLLQEINRVCPSTGVTVSVQNSLVESPINRFGNEVQKKKYLPRLASGEWIGGYALTEPDSGTDAAALKTTALKQGTDYILNGTKCFVTNGFYADVYVVYVRTNLDPALPRHRGISALIVERSTPGLKVGPNEEKLGIAGSSTVSLYFSDARVPCENLLTTEGKGFTVAMDTLDGGRIGISAQALGITQACLDHSLKYVKERKQFDKFLHEFESIQWKIAEIATDLDAARLLTYRAALLRDQGKPHTQASSMAKLFSATLANRAAKEAVQIFGGYGYFEEYPVAKFFRDAKITELYEGTSEVQHIIIARNLLKDA